MTTCKTVNSNQRTTCKRELIINTLPIIPLQGPQRIPWHLMTM